jgi:hypothetical protein
LRRDGALLRGERARSRRGPRRFGLLELDVLALETAGHPGSSLTHLTLAPVASLGDVVAIHGKPGMCDRVGKSGSSMKP